MRSAWSKIYGKKDPRPSKSVVTGYKSNVQGWREIGGQKHYFRSLWEIQFAQYLEWLKRNEKIVSWEYEPQLFKFPKEPYRTGPFEYLPDFRVTDSHGDQIWYEVKGYMNAASKKKLTRFKKHFPNEVIEIVDKRWFYQARKNKLHKIIGWEAMPILS